MNILNDSDLSFLIGAPELQQIAFSLHSVILHFGGGRTRIDIRSSCEVRTTDGKVLSWEPGRINDMTMFALLLDSEIRSYRILPGDKLIVVFSNGYELVLWDHQDGYESFLLWAEDGDFIAV